MRHLLAVRSVVVFFTLAFITVASALAQTPNTSSLFITVVDQNGGVIEGAMVSIENSATGSVRTLVTGSDGTVTAAALSLTGSYSVKASKSGFANGELKDVVLRSGEIANIRM